MPRLLIIDDDPGVAQIIGVIAEGLGFQVDVTDEHTAFFKRLSEHDPSHIAIDLMMPELDGVEILRMLGDMKCRAEIIITSGMGKRVLDAALRAGRERGLKVRGILPKPFLPVNLRELLQADSALDGDASGRYRRPMPQIDRPMLIAALADQQLRMVYQPKVTPQMRVCGFEALMRWQHPEHGELPPMYFITAAERLGVIEDMTLYALRASLDWLSRQQCDDSISMSVNLSVKDIESVGLADAIAETCRQVDLSPQRVTLELTETAAMTNPADALDVLARLRMKGFSLSIDDFGTGYSSMSQLARMPFSEIKVDRGFVGSALDSKESLTIVRAIVELAHNLELQAVAEGVENEATCTLLRELGCDVIQGYYISRPLEADAASAWLRNPVLPSLPGAGMV